MSKKKNKRASNIPNSEPANPLGESAPTAAPGVRQADDAKNANRVSAPAESKPEKRSSAHWTTYLLTGLLLAIALPIICRTAADPDLWGHLRFGADILQTGQIAAFDPYSYLTNGQKWINHEWLSEVAFAYAFTKYGTSGLVALKVVIAAIVASCIFWAVRVEGAYLWCSALAVLMSVLLIAPGIVTVRPQLFTYLCLTLLLMVLAKFENGQRWLLTAVPLIFVFWVNTHGGFLAGFSILLVWSLAQVYVLLEGEHIENRAGALAIIAGAIIACTVALLLNPYGWQLISFVLRTATVPRPEISEWNPIKLISPIGVIYLVTLVTSAFGIIFSQKTKQISHVVIWFVLALAPLISARHVPLFAVAVYILCGGYMFDAWNRWSKGNWADPLAKLPALLQYVAAALAVFLIVCVTAGTISRFSEIHSGRRTLTGELPFRSTRLLHGMHIPINVANDFATGEYLIYQAGPTVKVSSDGRRETVYSDQSYQDNIFFSTGIGSWDKLLDKYPTDMVLVGKDEPVYNLMKLKPGWSSVFEEAAFALFARSGSKFESAAHEYLAHHPIDEKSTELFPD